MFFLRISVRFIDVHRPTPALVETSHRRVSKVRRGQWRLALRKLFKKAGGFCERRGAKKMIFHNIQIYIYIYNMRVCVFTKSKTGFKLQEWGFKHRKWGFEQIWRSKMAACRWGNTHETRGMTGGFQAVFRLAWRSESYLQKVWYLMIWWHEKMKWHDKDDLHRFRNYEGSSMRDCPGSFWPGYLQPDNCHLSLWGQGFNMLQPCFPESYI